MNPSEQSTAVPGIDIEAGRLALRTILAQHSRLMVAYSGGVDSAYLAWEAHEVLCGNMLAVIADSPSLPRKELAAAIAFAEMHAIPLYILHTGEMSRPDYIRNDDRRCFYCKDELFGAMEALRDKLGFTAIAYGRNTDDSSDFRPGQRAAAEHCVTAPLAEAGLGKAAIRGLAQTSGLAVWDKPASACLSSRIEYGRPVSREALLQVEQAEDALHAVGFLHVRVRHHGDLARVELDRTTLALGLTLSTLDAIAAAVKAAGFTYITLDTQGYRSGSMNALLPVEALLEHGQFMRREVVIELLRQLEANKTTPEKVADRLALLPFEDLGFAKLDHHRSLRSGMPEVIYAAGKTPEQVAKIFVSLAASGVSVLATRASAEHFVAVHEAVTEARYHELARCITLAQNPPPPQGHVAVVCAGTSDLPIAEEAAITAELFGAQVTRISDVGVAGLPRLLAQLDKLRTADAIICCAGMEGALPSVIGGLVEVPVIAVPTSIGYGASFEGVAALLGMLNACSPNITVVNIDNGFGAGYVATLISRIRYGSSPKM